jgi:uncharacterized protein (DUF58 family)
VRRKIVWVFRVCRRNHNLLLVLAAFGTLIGLAAVSGYWLFYRAAYVVGGLVPISFVWARANFRGLNVTVEREANRLQVGQRAEARVRLANTSFYTKLWLEAEDPTDMPGIPPRTVVTLPAHDWRDWKASVACTRRGRFSLGPIAVGTGDPFGLFRFSRSHGDSHPLLVLPLPEKIPNFWLPPAQLPGEGTVSRRTHYVTPNAASVREYHPGDSYSRIHWRSTARLDQLMVKTFEMDPTSDIWVLLDLHAPVQAGLGDDSTEEYGVQVAASIGNHFLQANRMLGLIAVGRERVVVESARGPQQHARILEALAVAQAEGEMPLARLLLEEARRFGRHSTLIVVTSSPDENWVEVVQSLIQRGARAAVVLLEPSSFGGTRSALLPFSTLAASEILTYLVRCGDDLSIALGPEGMVGEAAMERRKARAG